MQLTRVGLPTNSGVFRILKGEFPQNLAIFYHKSFFSQKVCHFIKVYVTACHLTREILMACETGEKAAVSLDGPDLNSRLGIRP